MTLRSILLALVPFLIAVACGIAYLAMTETYDLFAAGKPGKATVVRVVRGEKPRVVLAGEARGEPHESSSEFVSEADLARLKPGDTVDVLYHSRSPFRLTLTSSLESGRPSSLLVVGIGLSVVAMIYILMLPTLARRRRANRTSGLDVITDALRRTRTKAVCVGGGIAAFGAAMIWLGASGADKTASTGMNIGIAIFGAIVVVFGVLILKPAFGLMPISKSWILSVIQERPEELAWMYEYVVQNAAVGSASAMHDVFVWLADGRCYSIAVEAEDASTLLAELSRRAPHAQIGYDQEIERLYKEQPSRFRPTAA